MSDPFPRVEQPFTTKVLDYKSISIKDGHGILPDAVSLEIDFFETVDSIEPVTRVIDLNLYLGWNSHTFNIWPRETDGKGGFYRKAKDEYGDIDIRIEAPRRNRNPRKSILQLLSKLEDDRWCVKSWIDMDVFLKADGNEVKYYPFLQTIDNSLFMYYLDDTTLRGLCLTPEGNKQEADIDLANHYQYDKETKKFSAMKEVQKAGTLKELKSIEVFNYMSRGYFLVGFLDDEGAEKVEICLSTHLRNYGGYLRFDEKPDTHPLSPQGSWTRFTRDKPVLSALMFYVQILAGEIEAAKDQFADGGLATIVLAASIFAGSVGGLPGAVLFAIVSTPIAAWAKSKIGHELIDDAFILKNYDMPSWQDIIFDTVQNTFDAVIGDKVGKFYKGWTEAYVKRMKSYTAGYVLQQGDLVIDYIRSTVMNGKIDEMQTKVIDSITDSYNESSKAISDLGITI